VIPEIDMPAHSYAAITSMNARESKLIDMKKNGMKHTPESYVLSNYYLSIAYQKLLWRLTLIRNVL
jgi:N-acetyl-beta-hexosaminidase